MATDQDIQSLRHDIRNLHQSIVNLSTQIGTLVSDQKHLSEWVNSIDRTLGSLNTDMAKAKGGYIALVAIGGAAGALGALIMRLLHLP